MTRHADCLARSGNVAFLAAARFGFRSASEAQLLFCQWVSPAVHKLLEQLLKYTGLYKIYIGFNKLNLKL